MPLECRGNGNFLPNALELYAYLRTKGLNIDNRTSIIYGLTNVKKINHKADGSARGALHPIFGCPHMHLLCQLTLNFHKRTY